MCVYLSYFQDLFQTPNPHCLLWTHELIGCPCHSPASHSSPSLSTDSDTPSNETKKIRTESDCYSNDDEADKRTWQLGPVFRDRITRSDSFTGIPNSESLAYLLSWKHSLSESAIADLNDPLLSALTDPKKISDLGLLRAVFSRTTRNYWLRTYLPLYIICLENIFWKMRLFFPSGAFFLLNFHSRVALGFTSALSLGLC